MVRGFVLVGLLLLLIIGCSEKSYSPPRAPADKEAPMTVSEAAQSTDKPFFAGGGGGGLEAARSADATEQNAKKPELVRKIIQTATVYLVTENFDEGEQLLRSVIGQFGGRVSNSDTQGSAGSQRSGRWKVRVPIDRFEAFKQAVEKIGNLERSTVESREVTEEYYDTQARLKNKTVEETRLIQHLEKSTGKLAEILEVERELSRVRGEIEQLQGRLNLLENLTSLTTVDIHLREVKNYTPPTATTFGEEASRTLDASTAGLMRTGKSLVLGLISFLPWLPVWIVVGLVFYGPVRWIWRRLKQTNRTRFEPTEAVA